MIVVLQKSPNRYSQVTSLPNSPTKTPIHALRQYNEKCNLKNIIFLLIPS